MSELKKLDIQIESLTYQRHRLSEKIYDEMTRLMNKIVLDDWNNQFGDSVKVIIANVDSFQRRMSFQVSDYKCKYRTDLYCKPQNIYIFTLDGKSKLLAMYDQSTSTFWDVDMTNNNRITIEKVVGYSEDYYFKGPHFMLTTLLTLINNNFNDIINTYNDLYDCPILENRQTAITILSIYKYCESPLNIFPKDIIRLLCKEIIKY